MRALLKILLLWSVTILPTHPMLNRLRCRVNRRLGMRIGEGTTLCCNVRIRGDVRIGKHCNFNENALIHSTGKGRITIGDFTIVGPNVVMRNANHGFRSLDKPIRYQAKEIKDILIEEDVWIAANVVVVPGAIIRKGAVIGAGAVVSGEIPAYAVAVGIPARVVKNRAEMNSELAAAIGHG